MGKTRGKRGGGRLREGESCIRRWGESVHGPILETNEGEKRDEDKRKKSGEYIRRTMKKR